MGFSRKRSFQTIVDTVSSGLTKDIDTTPFSDFDAIKYIIRAHNDTIGKRKIYKLQTIKKDSNVIDSIDSILGDNMDVDVQVLRVGADIVLRMANNETFDVGLKILKTIL